MVHNIKLKKRIWSLLLCLCMVLSCLPVPVFAESGTTTVAEAKWGTNKSNLTGSGTLAEAIAAANATGSTIKYILLNKSWTATGTDVTYYYIKGEGITFDLNGKTVSGTLCLQVESGSVTFTDSVGGGQWENTYSNASAVNIGSDATVTFTGGTYKGSKAVYLSDSNSIVVIKGGTFESTGNYAVSLENKNAQLTIEGGSFTGGKWSSVAANGIVTIKGGSFTAGDRGHIAYWGGTLDLSSYPATATTGTTALTDLTVSNWTGAAVTVGTNVKLPEGYGFYKVGDTTQTIVTSLAASSTYAIKSNGIPIAEAKWGTDKDHLTGSGTLAEAIAAAATTGSTVKYIQLNKSWTATGTDETYYKIKGEGVTFDLNGKTVSAALCLRASSGSVTFTDSVGGGQWENTVSESSAVIVNNATATFTGGSYKGSDAVYVVSSSGVAVIKGGTFTGTGRRSYAILNSGTLTIEGGVFNGGYGVASGDSQTTTITGGDFSGCTSQSVAYWGDTLDLSGYPTTATTGTTPLTNLTVNNRTGAAVTVGTNVKLPDGYGFYKSDDADKTIVTTLAASSTYAIRRETPEAKWGTSKDDLTGSGTLAEALAAVKNDSTIKYICLNKSWTATGTSTTYYEIEGTGITFDLNGQTVSGPLGLLVNSGSVTFTDSAGGGKWENTNSDGYAVVVYKATVTFTGGSYKGSYAVCLSGSTSIVVIKGGTFEGTGNNAVSVGEQSAQLTIEGGNFTGGNRASVAANGIVTIKGGTFAAGTMGHIAYWGGTLDLTGYPTTATTGTTALTDLTVSNWTGAAVTVGTAIKLPTDYGFYKSDDTAQTIVTELATSTTYAIKLADIVSVDITWTSMEFTYTDGVWNPETHDYNYGGWSVTGGTVTVKNTGNVTVTASFDYVSESNVTGIVGGFTIQSFNLDENESDTTRLILSGKANRRLLYESIGTITVTIAQKSK